MDDPARFQNATIFLKRLSKCGEGGADRGVEVRARALEAAVGDGCVPEQVRHIVLHRQPPADEERDM